MAFRNNAENVCNIQTGGLFPINIHVDVHQLSVYSLTKFDLNPESALSVIFLSHKE